MPPHWFAEATPRARADQPLDMRDRRFRQDAVTEVENERAVAERFEDGVDRTVERRSAGQQRQRIEIALNGRSG